MTKLRIIGSRKQLDWAKDIIKKSNLSEDQRFDLSRWSNHNGLPASLIIEHKHNLAEFADALREFYKLSPEEKRMVAESALALKPLN